MKKLFICSIASFFIIAGCKPEKESRSKTKENRDITDNLKPLAESAMNAFFGTYNEKALRRLFKEDYIQHNPYVPTGIEPIVGLLPTLKENGMNYKTHRIIQDSDYVVLHNSFSNAQAFGAQDIITFDIWRMEDGMVAEHWDAVTPLVTETVSGRSQTDGPTKITDLDKTEQNKNLVGKLVKDVFIDGNVHDITKYISEEQYDQHNPVVADGLTGLLSAIEYLKEQKNMFRYKTIHRILGEGNFVLVQSEGEWHNKPQAFYDLFRVDNNKIVEHWDVVTEIPSKMAHDNGMF